MLGRESQLLPVAIMMIASIDKVPGPTNTQTVFAMPPARELVLSNVIGIDSFR
jgi:hypothetical protein